MNNSFLLLLFSFSLVQVSQATSITKILSILERPDLISKNDGSTYLCSPSEKPTPKTETPQGSNHKVSLNYLLKEADTELRVLEERKTKHLDLLKKSDCPKAETAFQKYVEKVLDNLVQSSSLGDRMQSTYGVCFVSDPRNPNALDLALAPGGRVYVPGGFMLGIKSEAELAFALAHELSHHLLHHLPRLTYHRNETYGWPFKSSNEKAEYDNEAYIKYRQKQEAQADELGVLIMLNAGYKFEASKKGFVKHTLNRSGGEHPARSNRVRNLKSTYKDFKDSRPKILNLQTQKYYRPEVGRHDEKIPHEVIKEISEEMKKTNNYKKTFESWWDQ